jgi:hypothetical protein
LLVVTIERGGITIENEVHTMEFVLLLIGQFSAAIVYMSIQKASINYLQYITLKEGMDNSKSYHFADGIICYTNPTTLLAVLLEIFLIVSY